MPNAFFGIGALAIPQVVIQFGLGSVYYLARRFSGSLVPAMILHRLWDFSTFSSNVPYAGLAAPFIGAAAVIVVVVILCRDKRRA
ncbi:CPBP family glutamic-type intramembrane protease [Arthrobacter sp. CG_A4]|uniref:CPBP family glutamic-type intramembrane protease n=1 Tax=Arthrobacter sp. CG_A4 TaxID=3071706 RepID=UPI002DFEF3AA|nr:membrane protease YdiL (CAAX protease family) [Arthrobacter sp. CG_A4]